MGVENAARGYAVCFEDVTFTYSGAETPAIEHIDLRIEQGSCVVLTGRSGCGKTTLTRMMNGLIPVAYDGDSKGRVHLLGKDIEQWRMDEVSSRVGSVFQNPRSQFVNMDTTSEIAFGCEGLGLAQPEIVERVHGAARALNIEGLLDRSVEALSGGQRQMVILASAYAIHPDIYVLDEPTASLDVAAMRRLAKALAGLKAQGKTIIVSEHRLWWLNGVADRVALMEEGRIAGDWSSDEFAAIPLGERTSLGLRAWSIGETQRCGMAHVQGMLGREWEGVKARGVCAGYRGTPCVLNDLSLDLRPGRAVALVGKNGAGKTTLARCFAGLSKESAGQIVLDGQSVPWRKRAGRIYLVMQEPGYQLFGATVLGEMEESAERSAQSLPEESARHMLDDLGLAGLEDRHPLSLSGGERQRLSIGAGLLFGAAAMILDEPTSGLDYANMAKVARQIHRMKARGVSICIITHDYEFLCAACDDVALLEDGRIAQVRPINEETLPWVKEQFGF